MTRIVPKTVAFHRGVVTDDLETGVKKMVPMKSIAIVTPTYAPDYELCADLRQSMLKFTDNSVVHYLIVPPADVELFKSLRGPRCVVVSANEFLPRRMIWVPPWVNHVIRLASGNRPSANIVALNPTRPVPPVRGWIMQQILKLAAATRLDTDILLLVDSDVQFVRPITLDTLVQNGRLRQYRRELVSELVPGHVAWHKIARELLGLPPPRLPLHDYVSALNVWDRSVVLALLDRIERITRQHWIDALGGQLTFSEHILYGVFVDEVLGPSANTFVTSSSLCHSYWDTNPLDEAGAAMFMRGLSADDVAILIQSKSGTPLEIRRSAFAGFMTSAPEW